ncbi:MAG TPA: cupin domain-containing protein [Terriglobia bacterium]|jgi:transcriptional regulator with XRE-family HTH domain|nr:cupin domain-containing protein [Terriglobia bacterium]
MDIAEHQIAKRIRELRERYRLTLQQVAERAGLSKSFLSKVERSSVSISIAALARVANALGVSLGEFFEDEEARLDVIFVPREQRRVVTGSRPELPYHYEMLLPRRGARQMQAAIVSIDGARTKFELREHPGEQFLFVMEGEMEYICDGQEFAMRPGDCLYFKANIPHGPKLSPKQKVSYLVVFTTENSRRRRP